MELLWDNIELFSPRTKITAIIESLHSFSGQMNASSNHGLFYIQLIIKSSSLKKQSRSDGGALTYGVNGFSNHILGCDNGKMGELIIPREIDGFPITKTRSRAFMNCKHLTRVQIPDTVTRIDFRLLQDAPHCFQQLSLRPCKAWKW